jgi:hypothetical protein
MAAAAAGCAEYGHGAGPLKQQGTAAGWLGTYIVYFMAPEAAGISALNSSWLISDTCSCATASCVC